MAMQVMCLLCVGKITHFEQSVAVFCQCKQHPNTKAGAAEQVVCCAESSDLDLGEEICTKADEIEARTVVLLHHGKSLMKEMVFGSITSFATRNCRRPLVVYYP